jgi:phosphate starvation-inducible PhoH-like protein
MSRPPRSSDRSFDPGRDDAPRRKGREATETLHFEDAEIVKRLSGPNDRWLALIEEAFDVLLAAPGGAIIITGGADERDGAKRALAELHGRLVSGALDGEEAVKAAIRFARHGGEPGVQDSGAIMIGRRQSVAARTPTQAKYIETLRDCDLAFGVGPAGTGKTFLAVAYGVSELISGRVTRLVVTRPAVEAGERLGFLPGAMEEKVDPYLLPIWDALQDLMGREALDRRRANGEIEVAPLAFMRGRTLSNAYVIVDEAQNATIGQMKMVLTRIGRGARMVVTGDPSQVDLPARERSGLSHALDILQDVQGMRVVRFTRADVVRHPIVSEIVAAYDADAARNRAQDGES